MAHYARVNSENIVVFVTPVNNRSIMKNGRESDLLALEHLYKTIPDSMGDRWIKTSYNDEIRFRYAGIGYSYNEELDAFIEPQPYESWTLNEETTEWEAPVPMPQDSNDYQWDEETTSWVLV